MAASFRVTSTADFGVPHNPVGEILSSSLNGIVVGVPRRLRASAQSKPRLAMTGNFSTDLVEASKKHVHFLTTLHKRGTTLSLPVSESLRRYVDLWLTFVFKCQKGGVFNGANVGETPTCALVPPPDIAWLWHCHRLAPSEYEAYVRGRFGCLLEASPSFAVQTDDAADGRDEVVTRQKWNDEHPTEPFFLPKGAGSAISSKQLSSSECCESLNGFDLLASMEAQTTFLWQVSRPQFRDDLFLLQGVERYYKFLKLSSLKGEDSILVPTYQVRQTSPVYPLSFETRFAVDAP
jgi:Glycine-rich domain-containing protein-like